MGKDLESYSFSLKVTFLPNQKRGLGKIKRRFNFYFLSYSLYIFPWSQENFQILYLESFKKLLPLRNP